MLYSSKILHCVQPLLVCNHHSLSKRAFSSLRLSAEVLRRVRNTNSFLVLGLRNSSSDSQATTLVSNEPSTAIPDLDLQPTGLDDVVLNLAEPTFRSLGLSNFTPAGALQSVMEQIHLGLDQPWWATIVIATTCMRILVFPIVVNAQRRMINLNNHMPEYQKLQLAMARPGMTKAEMLRASNEFKRFSKANNINPVLTYIPMIAQGAVFASMFFALRGMTSCPVPSMTTGGCSWFIDLTVQDPYFLLPIITSGSLFIHLKLGADGVSVDSMQKYMRYFILSLPLFSLPFMCSFPSALNVYWLTSNFISIFQARLIRWAPIRLKLGIPEMIKWKPEDLPLNNLSFKSPFDTQDQKVAGKQSEMSFGPYLQRIQDAELEQREKRQKAIRDGRKK